MHEMALMNDLFGKLDSIVRGQGGGRVVGVRVWMGALSHISPEHFREHFVEAARGTLAEDARLEIEADDDLHDPNAQDILLRSIQVED